MTDSDEPEYPMTYDSMTSNYKIVPHVVLSSMLSQREDGGE